LHWKAQEPAVVKTALLTGAQSVQRWQLLESPVAITPTPQTGTRHAKHLTVETSILPSTVKLNER
jgi:hypothetical protein